MLKLMIAFGHVISILGHYSTYSQSHFSTIKLLEKQKASDVVTENNCKCLNRFITCFEEIDFYNVAYDIYNLSEIPHSDQNCGKENLGYATNIDSQASSVYLKFNAFGRKYEIRLHPKEHLGIITGSTITILSSSAPKLRQYAYQQNLVHYHGYLGNETVLSHGTFRDNVFDGVVKSMGSESIFVEPASRYFQNMYLRAYSKAVVYRECDISNLRQKNTTEHRKKTLSGLDVLQMSSSFVGIKTMRRMADLARERKVCEIHAVVDHTFFEAIGHSVDDTLREILYYLIEADNIFRTTDFDGDGYGDNIGFMIKSTTIYTSIFVNDYWFSDTTFTVDDVLDAFSLYKFNDVCLGILFTSRDYEDGVIGLAWVGTSSLYGPPTGICQKSYFDGWDDYNLNTALITTNDDGDEMPRQVNALTLTHELGHSFGSSHDKPSNDKCAPKGKNGKYIMYPYSTDASDKNNWLFSPCSIDYIYPVIQTKGTCLVIGENPVCGNRIVENGEQCDCGTALQCASDACCSAPSFTGVDHGCKLLDSNMECGSSSVCCENNCTITPLSHQKLCESKTACTLPVYCDGESSQCPSADYEPNGIPCTMGNARGKCEEGKCVLNRVCEVYGLEECQCNTHYFSFEQLCEVCCSCEEITGTCVPLSVLGIYYSDNTTIYLRTRHACNNFEGYCNKKHECINVDTEKPFEKLNDFFNPSPSMKARDWFRNYWYVVVILVAATALIFSVWKVEMKKSKYRAKIKPINTQKLANIQLQADSALQAIDQHIQRIENIFNR